MAQYFTDFSEAIPPVDMSLDLSEEDMTYYFGTYVAAFPMYHFQDAWQLPSLPNWSTYWYMSEYDGNYEIEHYNPGGTGHTGIANALFWHKPGVFRDCLVLSKIFLLNGVTKAPGVILRGSGDAGKENGYVFVADTTYDEIAIHKYVNGVRTYVTYAALTYSLGNYYHLKAECLGETVRAKIWIDGTSEPEEWSISATDSSINMGYCGLFDFEVSGGSYFNSLQVTGTPVSHPEWWLGWGRKANICVPYIDTDVSATGGKVLKVWNPLATADGKKFLAWDVPIPGNEVEIATRVKSSEIHAGIHLARIQCLGMVSGSGYFISFDDTSGGICLSLYIGADYEDFESLGSDIFPVSPNEWIWLRMYNNRNTKELKVKVWKDQETEPVDWSISTTDTGVTLYDCKGFVGIGSFRNYVENTQTYDFFGVGVNGDPAPTVGT